MRSIVYNALVGDSTLTDDIPVARWFDNSGMIDISVAPFAVISWGAVNGPMHGLTTRTLQIFVHDARGDYGIIDRVLARAEAIVLGLIDVQQGDSRVSAATWIGASGDLDDPEYKTNMRYVESGWQVASR